MWRFGMLTALCMMAAMAGNAAVYIIGGQSFLPLRTVGESFGASVFYNSRTGGVSISLDYQKVDLTVGSRRAFVGQREILLANPVFVYGGICYVPARFITNSFDFDIIYRSRDRQVIIINPRSRKQITYVVSRHVPPGLAKKGGIPPGQRARVRDNQGRPGDGNAGRKDDSPGGGKGGGKGKGLRRGNH